MRDQKDLKSIKKGSIGSQIKGQLIQSAENLLNNTFWWKIRPTLGPSIYGTKCDTDKPRYKIGIQSDWKSPKRGSSPRNLPTMPKYGCTHPPSPPGVLCLLDLGHIKMMMVEEARWGPMKGSDYCTRNLTAKNDIESSQTI